MPFSMPSYFLGVGTVVGALTLGFGGGILLTKTAIKDTPTGQSRIERVARGEPGPAASPVTEAKAAPAARVESPPVQPAEPVRQIQDTQVQAMAEPRPAAEAKPVVDAARQPEPAAEPVRQADKQIQPGGAEPSMSAREARDAQREQRRAERRIEREKRVAERRSRTVTYARIRQQPAEEPLHAARPELAFEREEPRPTLFEGLFGRPAGAASNDQD
ncbi:hypothetical protein [uncultured Bradyrhizobium sp.]|uniref:hypothetical protein n=1 Tax=uncultured Bradyrhizobium sp. TaxID=199684 RepID=UPI0035CB211F